MSISKLQTLSKHVIIFTVTTILLIFACKRTDNPLSRHENNKLVSAPPPSMLPTATSEQEIENQLKWIARGYVGYLKNPTKRNWITNHLLSQTFYEQKHDTINILSISNTSFDIEDEVHTTVDSNFSNNDYLRGYFYGFYFENCLYKTNVRLVDSPDVNSPWVVTYQSLIKKDTVWGYFENSIGNIDSIQIHSQNYDDYLIYCIFSESTCQNGFPPPFSGCNFNNVCEPNQGENEENCIDCRNNKQTPLQKRLEVTGVTILEDINMFDESWAENRYSLDWDWAIADGISGKIHGTRNGADVINAYNTWKKREIKICRKSCKGSPTEKQITSTSKTLYNNFEPQNEDVYAIFWEMDKRKTRPQDIKNTAGNIINFPANFDNKWMPRLKGGTFHTVPNGNVGNGVIVIPKGSIWIVDPSNPKRHTIEMINPSGEIKVKFAYFDY